MKVNTIIECYGYIKWFYLIDVRCYRIKVYVYDNDSDISWGVIVVIWFMIAFVLISSVMMILRGLIKVLVIRVYVIILCRLLGINKWFLDDRRCLDDLFL